MQHIRPALGRLLLLWSFVYFVQSELDITTESCLEHPLLGNHLEGQARDKLQTRD